MFPKRILIAIIHKLVTTDRTPAVSVIPLHVSFLLKARTSFLFFPLDLNWNIKELHHENIDTNACTIMVLASLKKLELWEHSSYLNKTYSESYLLLCWIQALLSGESINIASMTSGSTVVNSLDDPPTLSVRSATTPKKVIRINIDCWALGVYLHV